MNTEENMALLEQQNDKQDKKARGSNADSASSKNDNKQSKDYDRGKKYNKADSRKYSDKQSEELEKMSEDTEAKESVIIKKVSKTKSHGYKNQAAPPVPPTIEEPEKREKVEPVKVEPQQPEMTFEEALKPTPIITPVTRSSKDLSKRKKSVKKEVAAKNLDTNLQVDSQNFPALGQPTPGDSTTPLEVQDNPARDQNSRSPSKNKSPQPAPTQPPPQRRGHHEQVSHNRPPPQSQPQQPEVVPDQPRVRTMYNSNTSVLSMLDASYTNMRSEYEHTGEQVMDNYSDSTLFFIFYYQQGTYNQILAGEELIKRKWEYKSKFQTWFRDNDKTDRSKGDKIYFDFGPDWTTKIVKVSKKI